MVYILSLAFGLGLPALLTLAYHSTLNIAPLWVWLITINLTLMALMGKDKMAASRKGAKKNARRTPEFTLLLLTFLGGTPALLLGRKIFRHKTIKQEFIYAMWGTIAAQVACIVTFYKTLLHWL
jgi:uncharacterized membrane protein YsdA (DUF1294 family)